MKILAISGSLRATSLNTAVLHAAGRLAPAGVTIEILKESAIFRSSIPISMATAFPGGRRIPDRHRQSPTGF